MSQSVAIELQYAGRRSISASSTMSGICGERHRRDGDEQHGEEDHVEHAELRVQREPEHREPRRG